MGRGRLARCESTAACADLVAGAGAETLADVAVSADRVYLRAGRRPLRRWAETCQDAGTPGGPTSSGCSSPRRTPTATGWPTRSTTARAAAPQGGVTADGCPDADLDGVDDASDSCPRPRRGAGRGALQRMSRRPAAAGPPAPTRTVTIQSRRTHDAYSTSSRNVDLVLNWPKGADSVAIRNATGKTRVRDLAQAGPVAPPRTRKRPTVREVRVRFRGPGIPDIGVVDTIVFDPTSPDVEASLVLESAQGWYVGVNSPTRDRRPLGEAARRGQAADRGQRTGVLPRRGCEDDVDLGALTSLRRPAYIQVVDPSGNMTVAAPATGRARPRCPGAEPIPYRVVHRRWVRGAA